METTEDFTAPAEDATPLAHRTDQALRRLGGIGRTTLYALAKEGRIRPVHVGRVTLWPEAELRRLMAELVAEAERATPAQSPDAA